MRVATLARAARWEDAGCARPFPRARGSVRARRAGRGARPREGGGGEPAGGCIVSFALLLPRRAGRHWKAALAAGRRVIYRAGCARVTEPGPADGVADALGRGAESAGCAPGAGDNGLLCVQLPPPLGAGRGDGGRSPSPLPPARRPPKGGRPFLPMAGTGPLQQIFFVLLLVGFFFLFFLISKFLWAQLSLPCTPFPPLTPYLVRKGGT